MTDVEKLVANQPPSRPNINGEVHESESTPPSDGLNEKTTDTTPSAAHAEGGRRELKPEHCEGELPFDYPTWKKWWILTVIFIVQVSMNFNTSLYSNGIAGIAAQYNVSEQAARAGAAIFLVLYAFGCELWAPWSEELGRKWVLQGSLFFVNVFNLPVVLAPSFASLMVGRALGGLASAGGSVTLGMIADMFDSEHQQLPIAYIVFSSVGGSILGPIVGGFLEQYEKWQWCIWVQLIFGVTVQLLHLFTVPETRETVVLDNIAKKRRAAGIEDVYGPGELEPLKDRLSFREVTTLWARPFIMFVQEPIVLVLSLLSGFSDALIFMMIQSFALVYKEWDFTPSQIGLAFIPIGVGYVLAWILFIPAIKRNKKQRAAHPDDEKIQYESRMDLLLWLAPCLPIGLAIFGGTSVGPPTHWIGTMFGSCIIGIANYAIYMATIDYMICAYGPYSASATGGNGWARDFLAGVLTVPATPFFQNIQPGTIFYLRTPTFILMAIAAILVIAVYVIYSKGPTLRANSPFAQSLAHGESAAHPGHNLNRLPSSRFGQTSRKSSYYGARNATSRAASRAVSRRNSNEEDPSSRRHSHLGAPGTTGAGRSASYSKSAGVSRRNSQDGTTANNKISGRKTPGVSAPHSAVGSTHVPPEDLSNRLQKLTTVASEKSQVD